MVLLCLSLPGLAPASAALAQEANQAALVVVHGDGRVVAQCVAFSEAQLNGYDLLRRSGLDLNAEVSGMGATICRLDNEGCTFPQQSCFCQCEGESCTYWSYWQWDGVAWQYSNLGASNVAVLPGAVQGWVWGAGASGLAAAPPAASFASICAASTATSTATVTPPVPATATATATATGTWVPLPIAAPAAPATWTPLPTATPLPTPAPPPTEVPAASAPLPAQEAPRIEYFLADRTFLVAGESVTLAWRTQAATAVTLEAAGVTVPVAGEGTLLLAPQQNTTYLLKVSGPGGSSSAGLTIAVRPQTAVAQAPTPVPPASATPIPLPTPLPEATPPAATAAPTVMPASTATDVATAELPLPSATPAADVPSSSTVAASTSVVRAVSAPAATATGVAPDRSLLLLAIVGFAALVGLPMLLAGAGVVVWLLRSPRR